jgi:rhomboid protease GluP
VAVWLILNFLTELPGGGWDPNTWRYLDNLKGLGALVIPQSQTPGEWWRVLTAGFLHFGPLHLSLNLLGLFVFGPRLERAWGRGPMVSCYLGTTFTSMALAPYVIRLPDDTTSVILAGASGGIMGLVGGLIGYLLVGWVLHRNEHLRSPLLFLGLIVVLQTSFDLSTENVSFECHALGLATGVAFGTAWTWFTRREITP